MIYADNASTTKISEYAFSQMLPFLQEVYGNASSQYSFGTKARRAIELSRQQTAKAIGANLSEIVFTSGGTEGNSWVLQGIATHYSNEPIHIVTTAIEHHSVLSACRELETRGVSVTYIPVNENGCVSVSDVEMALCANTKLVSVMFANNEVGTIQPITEIAKMLQKHGVLFHTDAVQAVGHIPVHVKDLQVDILTASAHKFNGAKGTGFVFIKDGVKIPKSMFGGTQEHGKRAGTENVAGIVALGCALEECISSMDSEQKRLTLLSQITVKKLKEKIPELRVNAENCDRLPGLLNFTFPDVSGEALMHLLDLKGICVSTSSACNAGSDEPSHVLLALGLTEQQTKSSIRISYGRYNIQSDVDYIVKAIFENYKITKSAKNCL